MPSKKRSAKFIREYRVSHSLIGNEMSLSIKGISLYITLFIFGHFVPHHQRTWWLRWELGIVTRSYQGNFFLQSETSNSPPLSFRSVYRLFNRLERECIFLIAMNSTTGPISIWSVWQWAMVPMVVDVLINWPWTQSSPDPHQRFSKVCLSPCLPQKVSVFCWL